MLIDKGFYDYDYEYRERKKPVKLKQRSDAELSSILKRFGFNTKLGGQKERSAEELQNIVRRELKNEENTEQLQRTDQRNPQTRC